ncbi:MAG: hypothetical protein ACLR3C_14000 [Eggerthella lenta]
MNTRSSRFTALMSQACAPKMTRGVISAAKSVTLFVRASKDMSVSSGGRKYFFGEAMVVG